MHFWVNVFYLLDVATVLFVLLLCVVVKNLFRRLPLKPNPDDSMLKRVFKESFRRFFAPLTGAYRGARRAIRAELRRDDRELEAELKREREQRR